jgi:ribosomal-protein-alanine N-acetyltransferase
MSIPLPERLGDDQVVLRPLDAGDAVPYAAAFRRDPALGRFLGRETDPDEDEVTTMIAGTPQRAQDGRLVELAMADPATDAFWGSVLLHSFNWTSRRCEIGFWVAPDHRRRGVAARAIGPTLAWAFGDLDLLRVEMTTTPENPAVPELARRLGLTQEGVLRRRNVERGQRVDIIWFGLLREEWPAFR